MGRVCWKDLPRGIWPAELDSERTEVGGPLRPEQGPRQRKVRPEQGGGKQEEEGRADRQT